MKGIIPTAAAGASLVLCALCVLIVIVREPLPFAVVGTVTGFPKPVYSWFGLIVTFRILGPAGYLVNGLNWPFFAIVGAGFAVLPLIWVRRSLRDFAAARSRERGCCPDRGYDLRATPDRCPECGAAGG